MVDKEKQAESSQLLAHSTNAYNGQEWAKPKHQPGPQSRSPNGGDERVPANSQCLDEQEAESGAEPGYPDVGHRGFHCQANCPPISGLCKGQNMSLIPLGEEEVLIP